MIHKELYDNLKAVNYLLGSNGTLIIHTEEWLEYTGDRRPRDFSGPQEFIDWVQSLHTEENKIKAGIRKKLQNFGPDKFIDGNESIEELVQVFYDYIASAQLAGE